MSTKKVNPLNPSRHNMNILFVFVVFTAFISMPNVAFAQATAGSVICNAVLQMYGNGSSIFSLANLFSGIGYIMGTFFIGNGLIKLKQHIDSGQGAYVPLYVPIYRLVGGSCLLALPAMIGYILRSMLTQPSGNGGIACTASTSTLSSLDPSVWFTNFIANIRDPMTMLVSVLAYVIGAFFVVRGFIKLSKYGTEQGTQTLSQILPGLIVGALIFSIGSPEGILMQTLFGSNKAMTSASANVAGWKVMTSLAASAQFVAVVTGAIQFFQVIGAVAFLRGLMILKGAAEGSGNVTLAQGFTHIVGGILCLNMFYVLKAFDYTFGTNLL